jgi:4-alpha-glucanotransferase
MNIHFYIRYYTKYGQALFLQFGDDLIPMNYLNDEFWHLNLEIDQKKQNIIHYQYGFQDFDQPVRLEWGQERILKINTLNTQTLQVIDTWNDANTINRVFLTQPFTDLFLKNTQGFPSPIPPKATHTFQVQSPHLLPGQSLCLIGQGPGLHNWDTTNPIHLHPQNPGWTIQLHLQEENFPLGYKYGIWDNTLNQFIRFEEGSNRNLYTPHEESHTLLNDGFTRFSAVPWRGAGVAIPVFSLKSVDSFGIGEFTDINKLADWAAQTGLKLIQLLPINDTTANMSWTDSYPYAAVSAFALHPIYLNVAKLAPTGFLTAYQDQQEVLNNKPTVDYEAVLHTKWEIIRLVYPSLKESWLKNQAYQSFIQQNKHWLLPYAAFSYLRQKNGTPDFNQWSSHQKYVEKEINDMVNPKGKLFDEIGIHLFVQWHLHCQLREAVDYTHQKGIAIKGDIPIGIFRYSCDAWVAPELYNMAWQAGAPPDDFAEKGQNWGFPTYNWDKMKATGFQWWKQRFDQMKNYFDAFRIDHILGFFRIWSIPLDAVEGILGHFVPAIPVTEQEFHEAGIGFNADRLCKPFITEATLQEYLGTHADYARQHFFEPAPENNRWSDSTHYQFKTEYNTQRKILNYLNLSKPTAPPTKRNKKTSQPTENPHGPDDSEINILRQGLLNLHANVILIPDTQKEGYHFRFGIDKTSSLQSLPGEVQHRIYQLYIDYYFRRQDEFWKNEAWEKLPELKKSTNMLVCGEDLGLVPACVPGVMLELGILSLEIQRMPKQPGQVFFNPLHAPYLAVVTPATHDMSTIRGWWEEHPALTQHFYNYELAKQGKAPATCEPWINEAIIEQHLNSPAMWAIFQIQDLLGMDAQLRRNNPHEERINIPANPTHYWQYRMHLTLESLNHETPFNHNLKSLIQHAGRC